MGSVDRRDIAILVHGTFSTRARWTQPGSPLRQSVAQALPGAQFEELVWTGLLVPFWNNTDWARQRAARRLAELVHARHQDGDRVWLIGHSHGGNVALEVGHAIPSAVAGVVCMSTPFFVLERIDADDGLRSRLLAAAAVLTCFGLWRSPVEVPFMRLKPESIGPMDDFLSVSVVFALIVALGPLCSRFLPRPQDTVRKTRVPVLCLRVSSDVVVGGLRWVSLGIVSPQFAAPYVALVVGALLAVVFALASPVGIITDFGPYVLDLLGSVFTATEDTWWMTLLARAVSLFAAVILSALLLFFAALTFAMAALVGLLVLLPVTYAFAYLACIALSLASKLTWVPMAGQSPFSLLMWLLHTRRVEQAPRGPAVVEQVVPLAAGRRFRKDWLGHSATYSDPVALRALSRWLAASRAEKTTPCPPPAP